MIEIQRVYLPTETVGSWYYDGKLICKTLELPWKNNIRVYSCIPEGDYDVVKELTSEKHKYPHFRIPNVEGRSGILVHRITFVKDLKGCVGVGKAFADFDKDGVPDISQSTDALNELYQLMPGRFKLTIREKP